MRLLILGLALVLSGATTALTAQKPDDDATVRASFVGSPQDALPAIVAAFAEQQVTVSYFAATDRAAVVVAGPFPHDPATELTIRVSVWAEGDTTRLAIGGTYRLTVEAQGFQFVHRAGRGRDGDLWDRLQQLRGAICTTLACADNPTDGV